MSCGRGLARAGGGAAAGGGRRRTAHPNARWLLLGRLPVAGRMAAGCKRCQEQRESPTSAGREPAALLSPCHLRGVRLRISAKPTAVINVVQFRGRLRGTHTEVTPAPSVAGVNWRGLGPASCALRRPTSAATILSSGQVRGRALTQGLGGGSRVAASRAAAPSPASSWTARRVVSPLNTSRRHTPARRRGKSPVPSPPPPLDAATAGMDRLAAAGSLHVCAPYSCRHQGKQQASRSHLPHAAMRRAASRVAALLAPLMLAGLAGASWVLPMKFVPLIANETAAALLPMYANTTLDGERGLVARAFAAHRPTVLRPLLSPPPARCCPACPPQRRSLAWPLPTARQACL